jgi:hypothetical protein
MAVPGSVASSGDNSMGTLLCSVGIALFLVLLLGWIAYLLTPGLSKRESVKTWKTIVIVLVGAFGALLYSLSNHPQKVWSLAAPLIGADDANSAAAQSLQLIDPAASAIPVDSVHNGHSPEYEANPTPDRIKHTRSVKPAGTPRP